MTTIILDTHVVHWLTSGVEKLGKRAERALDNADQLAVSAISWYELADLAERGRISLSRPVDLWLAELATDVATVPLSPAIAHTAARLPRTLGGDPADRIIYATALATGAQLVTKDERLRRFRGPRDVCVW